MPAGGVDVSPLDGQAGEQLVGVDGRDLDGSLRERATGVRWMRARRPELYASLTAATGRERDTRTVRFEYGGK